MIVAHRIGLLHAGTELEAHGEEGAVFFAFQGGGTGFILARDHYAGAGWHEDAPDRTLAIRLGAVSLWVELEES